MPTPVQIPAPGVSVDSWWNVGPYEYDGRLYCVGGPDVPDVSNSGVWRASSPAGTPSPWTLFGLPETGFKNVLTSCADPLDDTKIWIVAGKSGVFATAINLYHFSMDTETYTAVDSVLLGNFGGLNQERPNIVATADGSVLVFFCLATGVYFVRWNGAFGVPVLLHGVTAASTSYNRFAYADGNTVYATARDENTSANFVFVIAANDSFTTSSVPNGNGPIGLQKSGQHTGSISFVFSGEIFIDMAFGGAVRASLSDLTTWTLDAPGGNWITDGVSLYCVSNAKTFDGGGNILTDVMSIAKYLGAGVFDTPIALIDYIQEPPPAITPDNTGSDLWNAAYLSDGSIGLTASFTDVSGTFFSSYFTNAAFGPAPGPTSLPVSYIVPGGGVGGGSGPQAMGPVVLPDPRRICRARIPASGRTMKRRRKVLGGYKR